MRIALAQLNYHIGDFENNIAKIKSNIHRAHNEGADLIVFAELAVCGYPPRDFLEFEDFIRKSEQAVETIAQECMGIAAIVGGPSINHAPKGKPLHNSAFLLSEGRIEMITHKTLLPNYDVFDEYRYFEPNRLPYQVVTLKNHKIGITICEDLWNVSDDPLYVRNPMDDLALLSPDLIINIAASPFHYYQNELRKDILRKNALRYNLPFVYVNQVGGQTELLFDGGSMMMGPNGEVVEELNYFEEDFRVVTLEDWDTGNSLLASGYSPLASGSSSDMELKSSFMMAKSEEHIARIHDALVMGIRDYFKKMGFSTAILGLSGGIDSALTMVLAAEALGNENVKGVLLPSQFSSDHSIEDAIALANNLQSPYDLISIEDAYKTVETTLHPFFQALPFGLAEENMQARLRAVILMALSNKFGYILLNTSNKSEAAVGYGTLYGDMCGGLSVLGDVYKTQVYQLSRYINRKQQVIPLRTIEKAPSAELRPGQFDSDSLPDYAVLDELLYQYIEHRKGPHELLQMGFEEGLVKRVLKLVNTNEYKRYQTPPILRISPKAFGSGRRLPIVAKYLT